jgi:hypothetical protein
MGGCNGSLYVLGRLLSRVSGGRWRLVKYEVVAQPIGGQPPMRPDAGTTLTWVDAADPLCAAFPRRPAVIARRFAAGGRCLVAQVKGQFAGFLWIQNDQYEEDEVRCTYRLGDPARAVWDFDVYVAPRYRLGRTLARLWNAADQTLAAEGVGWSLSRISSFNPESLSAHARLGTVTVARLFFLCAGRRQWAWQWRPGERWRRLGVPPAVELHVPEPAQERP